MSSTINREHATNVVLVVFLFYHANNVKGIFVVFLLFRRKNQGYCERMDN